MKPKLKIEVTERKIEKRMVIQSAQLTNKQTKLIDNGNGEQLNAHMCIS